MRSGLRLVFLGGLLAAAAPVEAQGEQTVENAQRFLSQVLMGRSYHWGLVERSAAKARLSIVGKSPIIDASAKRRCVSSLRFDNSALELRSRNETQRFVDLQPGSRIGGGPPFNWGSDLGEARASGTRVYLKWTGAEDTSNIDMESEALATRVAYAMEFLRQHCDPTAGTGF